MIQKRKDELTLKHTSIVESIREKKNSGNYLSDHFSP